MTRASATRFFTQWHRRLGWVGGITLLLWAFSGMLHPVMSWTGPKAARFYAPSLSLQAADVDAIPEILSASGYSSAAIVKVVSSEQGALLQLTQDMESAREYISLNSGDLLPDQDKAQAAWLASYYTGLPQDAIGNVDFQTEFSTEYSWVNRLLPVYRVSFPEHGNLVAYVHTETSALASLTNDYKTGVQTLFTHIHTWRFLDAAGPGRVLIVGLLILSLFLMACTGMGLVMSLNWRRIPDWKRRWHRIFSYVLWLPLLGWSASGFYHLLQAEYADNPSGMHLDAGVALDGGLSEDWASGGWVHRYHDRTINSFSVMGDERGQPMIRIGFADTEPSTIEEAVTAEPTPADEHAMHDMTLGNTDVTREERYAGVPSEKKSVYIDVLSGDERALSDIDRVRMLARSYSRLSDFNDQPEEVISDISLVTRFGADYDFRNKRLPVWKVSLNEKSQRILFIDPITSVLVDQNRAVNRAESWSFSLLHKWSHLSVIGRQNRDYLIVATLLILMSFAGIGLVMQAARRRKVVRPS